MRHRIVLLVGALAILVGSTDVSGQTRPWVVAKVVGEPRERAAFAPRQEPYSLDGPSIRVPVLVKEACRLPSGRPCVGFEFIGWHDADSIRVVVRALVGDDGGAASARGDTRRLEREQIATVALRPGEVVVVHELRSLGVTPVELSTALR